MFSTDSPYSCKFWHDYEELRIIKRSAESTRDRYRKYLKYLTDDNLLEILDFIENKGIVGYLDFVTESV